MLAEGGAYDLIFADAPDGKWRGELASHGPGDFRAGRPEHIPERAAGSRSYPLVALRWEPLSMTGASKP
jgi:hypothetical protein